METFARDVSAKQAVSSRPFPLLVLLSPAKCTEEAGPKSPLSTARYLAVVIGIV
jgi:hypothetical protein